MLTEILADRSRGASEIEGCLLAALPEALGEQVFGGTTEALLTGLTRAVRERQPSMANLLQLLDRSWRVWEEAESASPQETEVERHRRLLELWQGRRRQREGALRELGTHLAALWTEGPGATGKAMWTLLTLSRSGTVLAGLTALGESGARFTVVVGEGRPGGEGLQLAATLRDRGLDAWAATDAVVMALATGSAPSLPFPFDPAATAVVVGADAVGPEVFLNKVGTRPLAAAARLAGRPCWLLAETSKLLALELFRLLELPAAPPNEVGAPSGVPVLSFYFEPVPLGLATRVVSEEGIAEPPQVRRRTERMPVSRRLQSEWGRHDSDRTS
jgi:methylthioribose-1-phosphate isomerase